MSLFILLSVYLSSCQLRNNINLYLNGEGLLARLSKKINNFVLDILNFGYKSNKGHEVQDFVSKGYLLKEI